jgi:hypothetical protein
MSRGKEGNERREEMKGARWCLTAMKSEKLDEPFRKRQQNKRKDVREQRKSRLFAIEESNLGLRKVRAKHHLDNRGRGAFMRDLQNVIVQIVVSAKRSLRS